MAAPRTLAAQLQNAGLDHYNHNLDTSPDHYGNVIHFRTCQDRLLTTTNPQAGKDRRLFERLQLRPQGRHPQVRAHLDVCTTVAE